MDPRGRDLSSYSKHRINDEEAFEMALVTNNNSSLYCKNNPLILYQNTATTTFNRGNLINY
jgi:hypothetical protein